MSELTFYNTLLIDIKQRIRQAQTKAIMSANSELISNYWDIRHTSRFTKEYGTSILPQAMAKSPDNTMLAGIPWLYHCLLIEKIKGFPARF